MTKQVAVIEDDQRLLKRMALLLDRQTELECIIAARSLGEFFESLDEEQQPDLLLLDIELSKTVNALAHLKKIKNLLPRTKVLIITGHNHPEYILRALRQGADSFYLKGSGLPKLLEAIDTTFAGGAYLAPEAAVHVIPLLRTKGPNNSSNGVETPAPEELLRAELQLSPRERQVADGLASGQTYKEIAKSINLSVNTVRHYVKVLYQKFEVSNKVQLINKLKPYL